MASKNNKGNIIFENIDIKIKKLLNDCIDILKDYKNKKNILKQDYKNGIVTEDKMKYNINFYNCQIQIIKNRICQIETALRYMNKACSLIIDDKFDKLISDNRDEDKEYNFKEYLSDNDPPCIKTKNGEFIYLKI